MGCLGCTCSVSGASNDKPMGCRSGGCASGGCNRMNTFDWLTSLDIADIESVDIVEVTFKNGSRKGFYRDDNAARVTTGDMVVVDTGTGYDVGRVSLTGELVRLQMKKKRVSEDTVITGVIRRANERDLERLQEARELEKETMVHARAIARMLGLDMKIGDVEFQGDKRKATFFYTADGRVDFRELIRHYAKEFKVKIEMRQIGARQESARIGGIGSCGRELCCSTWLTDFRSVSTAAARYQNLAINQAKLSGQCGRLKCCLNYELDTYLDALDNFPRGGEKLFTKVGTAILVKTDIFKGLMFYILENEKTRGKMYALELVNVKEILEMNSRGEKPADLGAVTVVVATDSEDGPLDFEDVTGAIELPPDEKRRKKKKKKNRNPGDGPRPPAQGQGGPRPGGPPQGNQPPRRPDNRQDNRTDQRPDNRPPRNDDRPPRNDDRPPRNDDRRNKRNWKRKG